MKSLIKTWFYTFALFGLVLVGGTSWAALPIHLNGPKITDKDTVTPRDVQFPEDFTALDFKGGNAGMDLVVPISRIYEPQAAAEYGFRSAVMGLYNKDVLSTSPGPNTFFDHTYDFYPRYYIFQVLTDDFNANGKPDVLVVTMTDIVVCFDYNEHCSGGNSPYYSFFSPAGNTVFPWHAVAYDHNGDGRPDVAVIGMDTAANKGYLALFTNTGNPLDPFGAAPLVMETPDGFPLSVAAGVFESTDTKKDVVVAQMPPGGGEAKLGFFKNDGAGGYLAPVAPPAVFSLNNHCYTPTGLAAYNADGNVLDDLVLTCYRQDNISTNGGSVYLIKNEEAPNFTVQQEITGFKGPYTTALGDLNGDGADKPDLAVADYDGYAVVTMPGQNAFHAYDDAASRKIYSVAKYRPKFIQIHDMNADGLKDVVLTSSDLMLPNYKIIVMDDFARENIQIALTTRGYHGVLILLNYRPKISIDSPACNQQQVTVHCAAVLPGNSVTDCKLDPVPAFAGSVSAPVAEGTGLAFTFNIPNAEGAYNFTITASENGPSGANTGSENLSVSYKNCPPPSLSGCTTVVSLQTVERYWDDEWEVCVPSDISALATSTGKEFVWTQTEPSGPNLFTDFSGQVMAQLAAPSTMGCLKARFNPADYETRTFRGTVAIKDTPGVCGNWEVKHLGPSIHGQSERACSLGGDATPLTALSKLGAFLTPLVSFYLSRRRLRKN